MRRLTPAAGKASPRLKKLSPCLCALALFASAAAARATAAQDLDEVVVEGRVADAAGALVPGARVTAVRERDGAERVVLTDAEGRYRLIELEPGAYTVRADGSVGEVAVGRGIGSRFVGAVVAGVATLLLAPLLGAVVALLTFLRRSRAKRARAAWQQAQQPQWGATGWR